MNINIDDCSQILSHVLLEDHDLVDKITQSPEWKATTAIKAELMFNGVMVSAESFEKTLQGLFDQVETYLREKYDAANLDKLVEERAQQLLKEHADNALDKLYNLTRILEESEDLIVPHWERK